VSKRSQRRQKRFRERTQNLDPVDFYRLLRFWKIHIQKDGRKKFTEGSPVYQGWVISLTPEIIENILMMESL